MMAQPVEGTLGEISSSPSPPPSSSSPSESSSLSPSSIVTWSIPPVAFSDKSTNSGLEAGELFPILHVNSRSLTGNTHALYSSPASTVTFGKVATFIYSKYRQNDFEDIFSFSCLGLDWVCCNN